MLEYFDVSSEFIDFVFEVREDVRSIVGFDKIDDARYDIFPRFCVHEDEGNVELFEIFLHQAECLDNEIASCRASAMPLKFFRRTDINADKRLRLLLG